jgi:MFS transporter, DHA2 family, methylenomycin A resistance protein
VSCTSVRQQRLTLLAMSIAQGMIMIDVTIVNTDLPSIQRDLRTSAGGLEWVISAYALSLAALIPLGGSLGDRYGRKRLFLIGMAAFGVGSAACALSASDTQLIVSRALQGIGGAVMSALTLAILTDTYPRDARAGAIGIWAAIGGLGFGLGPVAGGLLLSVFSWPAVFWVNVPIAAIALALALVAVEDSRTAEARPLDLVGAATCVLGLFALTLGLIELSTHAWTLWEIAGAVALGLALLVMFVLWEQRTPSPMIPLSLLKARTFATGCSVYFLAYSAFAGVMFYLTLLYQNVEGWSALRTGASWLAMNLPFLVMAQFAGALQNRFPSRWVVTAGCLVGAAGIAGLSMLSASSPFALTCVWYVLSGIGYGTMAPPVANVAMRDVPLEVAGAASGALSAARQVGTSVGLALLGAVGGVAASADWSSRVGAVPSAGQLAQQVAGAQLAVVTATLGDGYWQPAVDSFLHGYHLAVGAAAVCAVLTAVIAAAGLANSTDRLRQLPQVQASPPRRALRTSSLQR